LTTFSQSSAFAGEWTGTEIPCTCYFQSDETSVGGYTDSALIPSAIGAGYGQINGNKYYLKALRVKGAVIPSVASDQADVPASISTRIILVLDTQPQGAQAQGENVFTDMGAAAQAQFSFLAMAAGSGGRFQILKDKLFMHNPATAGTDNAAASTLSTSRTSIHFKFNVNWKKVLAVQLKANSATPTVASLSNYNIFLLAHNSAGTASIVGCARAYYKD